jgi:hypothetical protein
VKPSSTPPPKPAPSSQQLYAAAQPQQQPPQSGQTGLPQDLQPPARQVARPGHQPAGPHPLQRQLMARPDEEARSKRRKKSTPTGSPPNQHALVAQPIQPVRPVLTGPTKRAHPNAQPDLDEPDLGEINLGSNELGLLRVMLEEDDPLSEGSDEDDLRATFDDLNHLEPGFPELARVDLPVAEHPFAAAAGAQAHHPPMERAAHGSFSQTPNNAGNVTDLLNDEDLRNINIFFSVFPTSECPPLPMQTIASIARHDLGIRALMQIKLYWNRQPPLVRKLTLEQLVQAANQPLGLSHLMNAILDSDLSG